MPDLSAHQQRALDNEDFFHELQTRPRRFIDWEVTALFYASLHWIHAFLASFEEPLGAHEPDPSIGGHHPSTHRLTRSMMSHHSSLQRVLTDFSELKDRSEDARYELLSLSDALVRELYANEFMRITGVLKPLLGRSPDQ